MTSAPASWSPWSNATLRSTSGWPAVTYGTKARRPVRRSSANRWAIRSEEIVADPDAIPLWVLRLDDGSQVHAVLALFGEIDQRTRMQQVALCITDDAYERPGQHFGDRIHRVDDPELEGVQNDQRSHRIDPGEVDERFHAPRIHSPPGVVPHLHHYLGGVERPRLIRAARGGGVESVRHCDDLAEHAHRARPDRPGIAGQVELHVMLVRHDHRPVGQLLLAAQLEEGERAHPRMRGDEPPLVVVQPLALVDHLGWHTRLADVVEQRRHPQIVQLQLVEAESLAQ